MEYLRKNSEKSGIIYCNTRKNVEEVHHHLVQAGYPAVRYHAGLLEKRKKAKPGGFYLRCNAHYGGDQCFWYGNRQVQCRVLNSL